MNTAPKIALMMADGCEEVEALSVADLLYRAGIPADLISVSEDRTVTSSHKIRILADACIGETDLSTYDMIVLPGGIPGTPNLKACRPLTDSLTAFHNTGKPLAAICAAPSILAELGMLEGVRATCNPSFEHVLTDHGADLVREPAVTALPAEGSGKGALITSRGMGTAIAFGLAITAYFCGKETAENLGRKVLYYT